MRRNEGGKRLRDEILVFDTGPLFLYFAEDLRVKEFVDLVEKGRAEGYTCETNMAEFYYKTCEKLGREVAEIRYAAIRNTNISIVPPDAELTRLAGDLKCLQRRKMSLADAYVAALARVRKGTLVTTDTRIAESKVVATRLLRMGR